MINKWGFIRETKEKAKKDGKDKNTGLHRTGLEEYLKVIFPNTTDWIHDKQLGKINNQLYKCRPDYRSNSLKLIVEFDGLHHYTKPNNIERDIKNTKLYENLGYRVVRIPYFIQLTNTAVETLFGVKVTEPLFNESIPSLGIKEQNTPAYLCPAGLERMAKEFLKFPEQYETNLKFLKQQNNIFLTGVNFLEREIKNLKNRS